MGCPRGGPCCLCCPSPCCPWGLLVSVVQVLVVLLLEAVLEAVPVVSVVQVPVVPGVSCFRPHASGLATAGAGLSRVRRSHYYPPRPGAGPWWWAPRSPRWAESRTASCSCQTRAWRGTAGAGGIRPGTPSICYKTYPAGRYH